MTFNPNKRREPGSTKAVVSALVDECGGAKEAAFLLGIGYSTVHGFTDPDCDQQISFDRVRRLVMARGAASPVADLAALAGGVFMPIQPSAQPIAELSAKSIEEHGEMMAALIRFSADGALSRGEAALLLEELDQHLRAAVALRSKLHAVASGDGRA